MVNKDDFVREVIFSKDNQKPAAVICYTSNQLTDMQNFLKIDTFNDLYSKKDMNLGRFNIDCIEVCCVARLPIVQFLDDARALINRGNFHRFNILNQYL